jgi:dolichyl-phosphate beta-glucosyltransferase
MKDLSVVIPAFNEENRIGRTLSRVREYLAGRKLDFEVLVVDDGSRDRTADEVGKIAAEFPQLKLLRLPKNQGKGAAVKAGMLGAEGRFLLMTDADLSTPIEELTRMEQALAAGYDLAIGSRRAAGAHIVKHQPWLRQTIGVAFGFLTGLIVPTGVADTQCGFKYFRAEAAKKIFPLQTVNGLPFDLEILALAEKLGFKIIEVPVDWYDAEGSKVRPLAHLPRVIREVLKIRWNFLRGKYFAGQ